MRRFLEDPKVPNFYGPQDPQYMIAVWAQTFAQAETARRVSEEVGKNVPVLPAKEWYDAEARHQNFFGGLLVLTDLLK